MKKKKAKKHQKRKSSPLAPVFSLHQLREGGYSFGDVESTYTTDCENEGCHNDGICRCSRVSAAHITSLDNLAIITKVIPKTYHSTILGYCVERIMRHGGVFNKGNWEVTIRGGYYGEEVHGIYLSYPMEPVEEKIKYLCALKTAKEMMEYVLALEYGYVLPVLQDKRWMIRNVSPHNVILGRPDYYERKLSPELCRSYIFYPFPRAVCYKQDKEYRLIDGYHRFSANVKNRLHSPCPKEASKPVKIIVAY